MKNSFYLLLILFVACAPTREAGTVGWNGDFAVGSYAPDIPVTTAAGEKTTFNNIRLPVAVIAFITGPEQVCCWIDSRLVNLASQLQPHSVTVAQISLPTENCPHGHGCSEVCRLEQPSLITLCDKDRLAWQAYNQPRPNTVFLIDEDNTIQEISTIDNLEPVAEKAAQLARARIRNPREDIY